jgi:hypothetical protein
LGGPAAPFDPHANLHGRFVYDVQRRIVVVVVPPPPNPSSPSSSMKSLISTRTIAIAITALLASTAQAQRSRAAVPSVPRDLRPPVGMCRVWVDGVPPDRQPAPTDCATALRNRPSNGRVLFGDDYAKADSDRRRGRIDRGADLPLKGLAPLPKSLDAKSQDSSASHKRGGAEDKKTPDGHRPTPHKPDSTGVTMPATGSRDSTR